LSVSQKNTMYMMYKVSWTIRCKRLFLLSYLTKKTYMMTSATC